MTINETRNLYRSYAGASLSTAKNSNSQFSLSDANEVKKSKREIDAENTAKEISDFFDKMDKYGNALTYVVKSNLEKIKEMIERKKEELKQANGFYSEPPLPAERKAELMKDIEKTLDEYKKEIMKELEEKAKAEKAYKRQTSLKDILAS